MGVDGRLSPVCAGRLLDDRYRLGPLLGQGGAAVVHDAVDTVLGRRVAVKLYRAADPLGRYRFASEARLLAGLTHPGLVTVYDVCLDDDQPFLVLQLVNGPTLREVMNPGPFTPDAVARIGAQLADALAYIHARDVVHRDVKPSNILVDPSGEARLADFGLARVLSGTHLTRSGEYVGTAAYLAPEQITDREVGPPADIYALGLVLLECLTGRTEYTGTAAETALARLSRPPRIPQELPPAWRNLLAAMTAYEPADRPDAARCAQLLTEVTSPTEPLIPKPRSAPVRPRAVHAGLAALVIAAVATVAASTTTVVPGRPTSEPSSPSSGASIAEPVPPAVGRPETEAVPPTPDRSPPQPREEAEPADTAAPDTKNKGPKDDKTRGKGHGRG